MDKICLFSFLLYFFLFQVYFFSNYIGVKSMLNKAMIIGRLGREPELKYTQTGIPVTTLNIATDESYQDRDGNRVEKTEWHRVIVFQRQAENCAQYLSKGSLVYAEGRIQTRKWQDQQGQDRFTTEIVANTVRFLDKKGDRNSDDFAPQSSPKAKNNQEPMEDYGSPFPSEASDMDDAPF